MNQTVREVEAEQNSSIVKRFYNMEEYQNLQDLHRRLDKILSELKQIETDLAVEAQKKTISKCPWHKKIISTKSEMINLLLNRDELQLFNSRNVLINDGPRHKILTLDRLSGFYTSYEEREWEEIQTFYVVPTIYKTWDLETNTYRKKWEKILSERREKLIIDREGRCNEGIREGH